MSKLGRIQRQQEAETIKARVSSYWTRRAGSFADIRHDEVHSYKKELWTKDLTDKLPHGDNLRILDAGCGTGFFEMLLAPLGYEITGIDLTAEMIEKGQQLLKRHNADNAKLMIMDAENTDFPNESFDAVISRNLTWNLPRPALAYREWHRVLKPGGVLINYDAEYAKGFHKYDQSENLAHNDLDDSLIDECHDIYHMLSISDFDRPEWDIRVLKEIGFETVETDMDAGDRLYGIRDKFYMPDRLFCIKAVKKSI